MKRFTGLFCWAALIIGLPALVVNWYEWQRALEWVIPWASKESRAFGEFVLCVATIIGATMLAAERGWLKGNK